MHSHLAERPEDFPYLVQLIIQRLNKKYNKAVESVSREVMQKIRAYPWPGNVRELENILNAVFVYQRQRDNELDLELRARQKALMNGKT